MKLTQNNILDIRIELGLGLVEFGKLIGVCAATVHTWETGKTKPNRTNLRIMERKLKKFLPQSMSDSTVNNNEDAIIITKEKSNDLA